MKNRLLFIIAIACVSYAVVLAQLALAEAPAAQNVTPEAPAKVVQAPSPPQTTLTAPKLPSMDSLDQKALAFDYDNVLQVRAQCEALPAAKDATRLRNLLDEQFRAKYPGYHMNWQTRRLDPNPKEPTK